MIKVQTGLKVNFLILVITCVSGFESHAQTLTPVSSKLIPATGTFWLDSGGPPSPFNPFTSLDLPVYSVNGSTDTFFIDDRKWVELMEEAKLTLGKDGGQYSSDSGPPAPGAGEDGEGDGGGSQGVNSFVYGTNLWLEITGITNQSVFITAHNTKSPPTSYYQLLSKPDLNEPDWTQEQVIDGYFVGTNVILSPVTMSNSSTKFFRVQQSDTELYLVWGASAIEPNPTTQNGGQSGLCTVARQHGSPINSALTVRYRVSGTASNGVDYTNLTGVITIPANSVGAQIKVDPIADYLIEGDETVIVTLLPASGYVIQPPFSQTVTIIDTVFAPVAQVMGPIGIDYHAPSNSLIVSCNFGGGGEPNNFARIYTNMVMSNSVVVTNVILTNWSGVHGLVDEVKLATAKVTANGFTNGQMFFSNNGLINRVGLLSPGGTVSNLNFAVLTNDTYIRGSLYVDQSGSFGGDLIAVTGNGPGQGGGVWRITSTGAATQLANIANTHLEGVITLTNDPAKWGPWAGKILAGAEDLHAIFAISTNGVVTTNFLGIDPEDFDIIPPNQNLYACDPDRNLIVKLSAGYLTNCVGDLLITQAGETAPDLMGKLFIVHWDATITNFVTRSVTYRRSDGSPGHFEHVTFAPMDIPPATQ